MRVSYIRFQDVELPSQGESCACESVAQALPMSREFPVEHTADKLDRHAR
jgi:hypothetical protein